METDRESLCSVLIRNQYHWRLDMHTRRSELPMLSDASAIYGGGESVTGAFCFVIAILIFIVRPV